MDQGLNELRRSLAGAALAPADPGYDAARRSFNALVDRRPAVIVRCLGADDIATAFDFARAQALEVAVRGGGHNPIEPWSVSGGYVDYMQADEPIDRVRAAFGEQAFERLQALKRRHDPDNCIATRTSRRRSNGRIHRVSRPSAPLARPRSPRQRKLWPIQNAQRAAGATSPAST